MFNFSDSVVQRLARWISNPEVVGSNPTAINMSALFRSAFKRFGESFALEMQQKWLRTQKVHGSGRTDFAIALDGLGGLCHYPCRCLCNMRPNRSVFKLNTHGNNHYCKG